MRKGAAFSLMQLKAPLYLGYMPLLEHSLLQFLFLGVVPNSSQGSMLSCAQPFFVEDGLKSEEVISLSLVRSLKCQEHYILLKNNSILHVSWSTVYCIVGKKTII